MAEFDNPTYVIDLTNSRNISYIEHAEPRVSFALYVVPDHDATSKPVLATATLNAKSTQLSVHVETATGAQDHVWTWDYLKDAIEARRS